MKAWGVARQVVLVPGEKVAQVSLGAQGPRSSEEEGDWRASLADGFTGCPGPSAPHVSQWCVCVCVMWPGALCGPVSPRPGPRQGTSSQLQPEGWSLGAYVLKIGLRQPLALDLSGWWEARVAVPEATARAESLGFFQAPGPLEGHL